MKFYAPPHKILLNRACRLKRLIQNRYYWSSEQLLQNMSELLNRAWKRTIFTHKRSIGSFKKSGLIVWLPAFCLKVVNITIWSDLCHICRVYELKNHKKSVCLKYPTQKKNMKYFLNAPNKTNTNNLNNFTFLFKVFFFFNQKQFFHA